MRKLLKLIIAFTLGLLVIYPQTSSAASKTYYYSVAETSKNSAGIYQSTPNGKSKLILKASDKKTKKPIGQVQSVGKDVYFTKYVSSKSFFGGSCGGGGADIQEIYKRDSKGKVTKVNTDKVTDNPVKSFQVEGSSIFYAKYQDHVLRNYAIVKSSLDGKKKQTLIKGVDDFWMYQKSIYYVKGAKLYKMDSNGKGSKAISSLKPKLYGNSECDGANYWVMNNGLTVQHWSEPLVTYYYDFATGKVTKLTAKAGNDSGTPQIIDVDTNKKRFVALVWDGREDTMNLYDFNSKKLKTLKKVTWPIISLDSKKGEYIYLDGVNLKLIKF